MLAYEGGTATRAQVPAGSEREQPLSPIRRGTKVRGTVAPKGLGVSVMANEIEVVWRGIAIRRH
ncbi:MAG: hypothetical protein M3R06_07480, partial [Chloroflexota bacterium]|nr:hypothetical protein [Chloroflexota bacterium]